MRRLDQMLLHYGPRWGRKKSLASFPKEEQIKHIADGLGWFGPDAEAMLQLLDGLGRIPEGDDWLKANQVFLDGVRAASTNESSSYRRNKKTDAENASEWLLLSNRVHQLHVTNAIPVGASPP